MRVRVTSIVYRVATVTLKESALFLNKKSSKSLYLSALPCLKKKEIDYPCSTLIGKSTETFSMMAHTFLTNQNESTDLNYC